jgi:hypothetical protein
MYQIKKESLTQQKMINENVHSPDLVLSAKAKKYIFENDGSLGVQLLIE